MNEFLVELREMKTFDFWHNFLQNECQFRNKNIGTTAATTATTATTGQQQQLPQHDAQQKTTEETQVSESKRILEEMDFETSQQFSPKLAFNSSAFFDPQFHPSITDQVFMCRKIAKQLVCDESNAKSKGREMFEKRVQKSSKWVTTATDDRGETEDRESEQSFHETTISEGPPNLRLLFDPRHVQDLNSLSFDSNEKEIIREEKKTRDLFQNKREEIMTDLTSPEINPNKGNALFAKRQQKSNEWIVAETVVQSAFDKQQREQLSPFPHTPEPAMLAPTGHHCDEEWTTPRTTPEVPQHDSHDSHDSNININSYIESNNILSNSSLKSNSIISIRNISNSLREETTVGRQQQMLMNRFKDFNARARPFARMY